eukprot:TRINITY_DN524_c0_g1_i6.p1 TRINITY_DN524_c0_g1~~TRINITY_DN524_c0_g1_i6.p1  ORF type:complete len:538 (-),score=95.83 TRINITY_DN524_c0_g1_i6:140-1753(-)
MEQSLYLSCYEQAEEPMAEFVREGLQQIVAHTAHPSDPSVGPAETRRQQPNILSAACDAAEVSLFSSRRPKHIAAGAGSAAKNVIKGVGAGAACLLAAPVIGAQTEGLSGLGKGLAVGAAAMLTLPIVGLATGARQLREGARNTPEAFCHARNDTGKDWNPYLRRWISFNLQEQCQLYTQSDDEFTQGWIQAQEWVMLDQEGEVMGDEASSDPAAPSEQELPPEVADTALYDLLHVATDAELSTIKQSYWRLARTVHPDKCSDPQANTRFQALSEAYQVLSDPQLRAMYDTAGQAVLRGASVLEAHALFELLFEPGGCDAWEAWIGQPQAVTLAQLSHSRLSQAGLSALLVWKQQKREHTCSLRLAQTLDEYTGDPRQYSEWTRSAVLPGLMSEGVLSGALLGVLGGVFEEQANQLLAGTTCSSALASVAESARGYRTQAAVFTATAKVAVTAWANADDTRAVISAAVEALYAASVNEIEATLRISCWNVLHDRGLSDHARLRRAVALALLGECFCVHSSSQRDGLAELQVRVTQIM